MDITSPQSNQKLETTQIQSFTLIAPRSFDIRGKIRHHLGEALKGLAFEVARVEVDQETGKNKIIFQSLSPVSAAEIRKRLNFYLNNNCDLELPSSPTSTSN